MYGDNIKQYSNHIQRGASPGPRLKSREDGWNSRFTNDRIPILEEKTKFKIHKNKSISAKERQSSQGEGGKNLRLPSRDSQKHSLIPGKKIVKTPVFAQNKRPPISKSKIDLTARALQELSILMKEKNIPDFHQKIFAYILSLLPQNNIIDMVKNEIDLLQNNKSLIQNVCRVIKSRENCLNQLKICISSFENCVDSSEDLVQIIQDISKFITHMRVLTITAVEWIVRWRETLNMLLTHILSKNSKNYLPFIFYYNEENYLLKLEVDCNFIRESSAALYFKFSQKNDPFFLECSKEIFEKNSSFYSVPLSKGLTVRIRACIIVIIEESAREQIPLQKNSSQNSFSQNSNRNSMTKKAEGNDEQFVKMEPISNPQSSLNKKDSFVKKFFENNAFEQKSSRTLIHSSDANYSQPQDPETYRVEENKTDYLLVLKQSYQKIKTNELETNEQNVKSSTNNLNEKQTDQVNEELVEEQIQIPNEIYQSRIENIENIENQNLSQLSQSNYIEGIHVSSIKLTKNDLFNILGQGFTAKIDKIFRLSLPCNIDDIYLKGLLLRSTRYLKIRKGKEIIGAAVVGIDPTRWNERRMIILHFSVFDKSDSETALAELLQYIWIHDSCTEIRIKLLHFTDEEGNQVVDPDLKALLSIQNFRWKQLENNSSTGERILVMGLRRPENIKSIYDQNEPLVIEALSLYTEIEIFKNEITLPQDELVDVRNVIIAVLKQHYTNLSKIELATNENNIKEIYEKYKKFASFKFNEIRSFKFCSNCDEIHNKIIQNMEKKILENQLIPTENINSSIAMMKAVYRPGAYDVYVQGSQKYFRIKNAPILKNNHNKFTIYVCQTDDSKVSMFFVKIKKDEINENLGLFLKNIFDGVQRNDEIESSDCILVPCFQKKMMWTENKLIETLENASALNYLHIIFDDRVYDGEIQNECAKNDSIISSSFVFGILHTQIEECFEIPYISCFVSENDFVCSD